MDPLIAGYLSYLDKIGRKTPRTRGCVFKIFFSEAESRTTKTRSF